MAARRVVSLSRTFINSSSRDEVAVALMLTDLLLYTRYSTSWLSTFLHDRIRSSRNTDDSLILSSPRPLGHQIGEHAVEADDRETDGEPSEGGEEYQREFSRGDPLFHEK